MSSLATKYRPKTFEDVVEQDIVTTILNKTCSQDSLKNRNFLLIGSAGCGKALPSNTPILTPTGFIKFNELNIGDKVMGGAGIPCNVLGLYPQGELEVYRMNLSDGSYIDVSEEHINVVYKYNFHFKSEQYTEMTTKELIEYYNSKPNMQTQERYRIPFPVLYFDNGIACDNPYTLGVNFANDPDRYYQEVKKYLFSDFYTRISILQGICDTKVPLKRISEPVHKGRIRVTVSNLLLKEVVECICRSLGILCRYHSAYQSGNGFFLFQTPKGINVLRNHTMKDNIIKVARYSTPVRSIVNIEYIGKQDCICMEVDDKYHSYIATEFMIPTHNTTSARIMANMLNEGKSEPIEIDAASNSGVDNVRELIQQARSYPVGSNYKVFIIDECFSANTKVRMFSEDEFSIKSISEIQPGEKVCSGNGYSTVKQLIENHVRIEDLVKIKICSKREIYTNKYHLFFTLNRGWVKAKYLEQGDRLCDLSFIKVVHGSYNIEEPTVWEDPIPAEVYNENGYVYINEDKFVNAAYDKKLQEIYQDANLEVEPNLSTVTDVIPFVGNFNEFKEEFTLDELGSGIVKMYDLVLEGDPTYYITNRGFKVHNCHAFSNQAWQALLKTLEESPAKSVFILATTNPEKIPETILSRVQTFQLSKISLQGIFNRLKYVIDSEIKEGRNITYTDDALYFIGKLANGGMRDALTTLDKVLAYTENLTSESVVEALNLPNYDNFFLLLGAYYKKDNMSIANIIDSVYNSGINFVQWMDSFYSFVINIMKYVFTNNIDQTTIPTHYLERLKKYGRSHASICLKLGNILIKLINELKQSSYPQELALTYLCS